MFEKDNSIPFTASEPLTGDPKIWEEILRDSYSISTEEDPLVSMKGKPIRWLMDFREPFMEGSKLQFLATQIIEELKTQNAQAIVFAGVAGTILGSAVLALYPNLRGAVCRDWPKTYGKQRYVEGRRPLPQEAILVDDLLNNAANKVRDIANFGYEGISISSVLSLANYDWGRGKNILENEGYYVRNLVTLYRKDNSNEEI